MDRRITRSWLLVALALVVPSGGWYAAKHDLLHMPRPDALRKALTPAGGLRGIARDAGGHPLSDATVDVFAADDGHEHLSRCDSLGVRVPLFQEDCPAALAEISGLIAKHAIEAVPITTLRTDEHGAFEFALPPGRYDLLLRSQDAGAARAIDVATGGALIELTATRETVTGVVTADSAALGDVDVLVLLPRPRVAWAAKTSASGQFVAAPLPLADHYTVWAHPDGFSAGFANASPHELPHVDLSRLQKLVGHVTRDQKPVEGAAVTVGDSVARTDANGAYSIDGADCQGQLVMAQLRGLAGAAIPWPAEDGRGMIADITMEPAMRLRLNVVDGKTGAPIANADVELETPGDDDGSPGYRRAEPTVARERSGEVVIDPMATGTWSLLVGGRGHLEREVEVEADGTAEKSMTVSLEQGNTLHGIVVTAAGKPVAGAVVSSEEHRFEPQTTGEQGGFTVDGLEDGEVILQIEHPDYQAVEVTETMPEPSAVRVELDPAAILDVLVLDPSGHPVANAEVWVRWRNGKESPLADTEDNGRARSEVPGEQFTVTAIADGLDESDPVDVDAREGKVTTATVHMKRGLTLDGHVVDTQDRPVVGVILSFTRDSGHAVEEATTESDGSFRVAGLADDTYAVSASGFSLRGSPRVHGGDTDVRVVVIEKATVRGTVLRDGVPVQQLLVDDTPVNTREGAFVAEVEATNAQSVDLSGDFLPVTVPARLTPGADIDVGEINVQSLGGVTGFLTHGGRTIGPVTVAFEPVEHSDDHAVRSPVASDGSFTARSMKPGPYTVVAETNQGPVTAMVFVESGKTARVQLDVPSDYDFAESQPITGE